MTDTNALFAEGIAIGHAWVSLRRDYPQFGFGIDLSPRGRWLISFRAERDATSMWESGSTLDESVTKIRERLEYRVEADRMNETTPTPLSNTLHLGRMIEECIP